MVKPSTSSIRCKQIVNSLPAGVLVSAVVHDDDPLILACLPHPAVITCIQGWASEADLDAAEAWVASRPDVQKRAAFFVDRLLTDLAGYSGMELPGWVGSRWSAIIRCPWAHGLDEAVAAAEEFFSVSQSS